MKALPFLVILNILLAVFVSPSAAQTSSFTYQGHLMDGGSSANGNYDILFTLKNALTAGSTVGTPQSVAPVNAVNGIFTVTLDFGSLPFDGSDRWVELAVRPAGSSDPYTVLAPRQQITAVPYSMRALNATNLTGSISGVNIPSGTITGSMLAGGAVGGVHLASGLTLGGTTTGTFSGPLTGNVIGNVSGSAASFTGLLAGDVTGTQSATVVGLVGGVTAANVASGTNLANAATNANVASTLVKRDANGNFTAGAITGSLNGNATSATSATSALSALSAASFTGALGGDVTGTQGATVIASTTVTGKVLTGFASVEGTISATDTILGAIGKLDGNVALRAPLASPTFTGTVAAATVNLDGTLTLAVGTETLAPLKLQSGVNLTTPVFGAVEFDGTNVFVTNNSTTPTRKTLAFTDSVLSPSQISAGTINSTMLASSLTLAGTTSGTFSGNLTGNVSGSATSFTGSLAGDVTGTQGATVVASVGGSSAVNVNAAELLANAATSLNTASTIVKRDANGNFSVGTVTTSGGLNIAVTTSASVGVITQGGSSLIHSYGTTNFFAGVGAGNFSMTGSRNTATGHSALQSNTDGNSNTASGFSALQFNNGQENTATGAYALRNNTIGSGNTASGVSALGNNLEGSFNTANGYGALLNNTMGSYNTASGEGALRENQTGSYNTANGSSALWSNTTGSYNTASGDAALGSNTTGSYNVADGYTALGANTTGERNTATGVEALRNNTTGNDNTGTGNLALGNNGTAGQNVALGSYALSSQNFDNGGTAWNSNNVAVGFQSLYLNGATVSASEGINNTAIGTNSLGSNTTGSNNIGVGNNAGHLLTTGSNNIAIGHVGVAGESGIIRIGTSGTHTDTYLAGVIRGNGSGLTGVPVTALTGALVTSQIANGAVDSAQLASGLTLAGTTTGTFSGPLTGNVTGNVSGSAASFTGSLAGDVTGTQGATVVAFVGGSSAANVHAAELLANSATNTNTAGAIVRRDAGGSFSAGTISISGMIQLPATSSATVGVVTQAGSRLMHSFGTDNFFAGINAGNFTMTGGSNTASGVGALFSNTEGGFNVASGFEALFSNTEGSGNTAVGNSALHSSTIGDANTAIGAGVLENNTSGGANTAIGSDALVSNTTGYENTASGVFSLESNTTGTHNTASGSFSLQENTTGTYNIASGALALQHNTTGSRNIAIGYQAGFNLTNGSNNIAVGHPGVAGDSRKIRIGTDGTHTDMFLAGVIHGDGSGLTGVPISLPATTSPTVGVVTQAGSRLIHSFGSSNFFAGINAGNFSMTGDENTAVGVNSLIGNTTGASNVASGFEALFSNNTGHNNTSLGTYSLHFNTSGVENTATGAGALENNTTGNGNIAIGYEAGLNLTTGSNNITVGHAGEAGESGNIRIGTSGTHAKAFVAGIRSITTGVNDAVNVVIDSNGQLGTISSSRRYKEDISDMGDTSARLQSLRPVTFRYKQPYANGGKPVQFGLIAEEVAEVFPELAVFNDEGQPETVKYQDLTPLLLNEVQKLRTEKDELARKLAEREAKDKERDERIARLESLLSPVGSTTQTKGN